VNRSFRCAAMEFSCSLSRLTAPKLCHLLITPSACCVSHTARPAICSRATHWPRRVCCRSCFPCTPGQNSEVLLARLRCFSLVCLIPFRAVNPGLSITGSVYSPTLDSMTTRHPPGFDDLPSLHPGSSSVAPENVTQVALAALKEAFLSSIPDHTCLNASRASALDPQLQISLSAVPCCITPDSTDKGNRFLSVCPPAPW